MVRPLLFALMAILAFGALHASAQQRESAGGPVLLVEITGAIGPPAAHQVAGAVARAEARNAEALILQINTPGGLETSMRDIIEDILASRVPVVGYVAPAGGRAASAGAFVMYATHVAAMAPGTNIGAATPVMLPAPEGEESEEGEPEGPSSNADALDRKAVNDAAAFIRSLAVLRGRNAEWAERAVRQGEAASAREAHELGVVELVAEDLEDLLGQLDGRTVAVAGGERTLSTRGRTIERVEPSFVTRALGVLANPNIAFLLMMIGVYGIIFEFMNPGAIAPGVFGAVCLVLGLYSLNMLPLNYAGLALILLGIAFMIAEAFTPTFGVLGIGGAIAFVIGAAMLIDTDVPEYQLSWPVIIGAGLFTGGFVALAATSAVRSHRRRVVTGREALIGARAEVLDWSETSGHVWAASERWNARGPAGLAAGQSVRVTGVDGLRLEVAPEPQGEAI